MDGCVDPLRDIETVNLELIFSDIEVLDRRIIKLNRGAKNNKEQAIELELAKKLKAFLEEGNLAVGFECTQEEKDIISTFNLLTSKPVIYAANVSEDDLVDDGNSNEYVQTVRNFARSNNSETFVISAKIEEEISQFDDEEKEIFLQEAGISESGLNKLIKASYSLLGLMSFLTAGEQETRAWTIEIGTKAPQAAGKIHTDFERGFIKAEVISFDELIEQGSYVKAKEKGLVRLEGKDYIVQDGDIILFRFNV